MDGAQYESECENQYSYSAQPQACSAPEQHPPLLQFCHRDGLVALAICWQHAISDAATAPTASPRALAKTCHRHTSPRAQYEHSIVEEHPGEHRDEAGQDNETERLWDEALVCCFLPGLRMEPAVAPWYAAVDGVALDLDARSGLAVHEAIDAAAHHLGTSDLPAPHPTWGVTLLVARTSSSSSSTQQQTSPDSERRRDP